MTQFVLDVKKALVPLAVAGVAVVLKALNIDIPVDDQYIVGAGVVQAIFVFLAKNGVPFFSAE